MSIASTITLVQTNVAAITGIVNTKIGMPNEAELGGNADENYYPLAVISGPHNFRWTRSGMGVAGKGFVEYDVRITVVVGSKNASEADAIARAMALWDRFRAKFAPDWTLGSTIFNADLLPVPADNVDTFRQLGQPPIFQPTLHIQDERTANQAAS